MQTKLGDNAIYVNKPKRMRQYLLQKSPYNQMQQKSSRFIPLYRSLEKDASAKQSIKSILKSEMVELVESSKNNIKTSVENARDRRLNLSVNINKFKKSSLRLDLKQSEQQSFRNIPQLSLASLRNEVRDGEGIRYEKGRKSVLFPFKTIERQSHQSERLSQERNQKCIKKGSSLKKGSEPLFNFRPRYSSLQKKCSSLPKSNKNTIEQQNFVQGFTKGKRLGKGGFSVVWEAIQHKTGKVFAIKEIDGLNQFQTHLAEITFSSLFFQNGIPKPKFEHHPGINALLAMHKYQFSGGKVFIVYEKCTASLGEMFFDIYEENEFEDEAAGQKYYVIVNKPIYRELKEGCEFLKNFIFHIAQALALLQSCNIVHSDMKTSNILMNMSEDRTRYSFKLIDYGSSFIFKDLSQYRLATPEYMPPELINYLNRQKGRPYSTELLECTKNYKNLSAIDMWGLGCILLEIVHGVPLWLHNKVKLKVNGVQKITTGKFATESRAYVEILDRQLHLINHLNQFLEEEVRYAPTQNNNGIALDAKTKRLIKGMLQLNPEHRMRPHQVLQMLNQDNLCRYS